VTNSPVALQDESRTAADIDQATHKRHESNRQAWNEAVHRYERTFDDDLAFLRTGAVGLHVVEQKILSNLTSWCDVAIHLQCASGRDTLSLRNAGAAQVIGVDISDAMIALARQLSSRLEIDDARWYRCDVLDTPHELDGTADLVYTGQGALTWIHDLRAWAQVVERLLKPGGMLHLYEMHPIVTLFKWDEEQLTGSGVDYFAEMRWSRGWSGPYIGDIGIPKAKQARKCERLWPVSSVVQCLLDEGLVLEVLSEHPEAYWPAFPNLSNDLRKTIPMTYRVVARKASGIEMSAK
jgi:SAM-dependent methyltransferase